MDRSTVQQLPETTAIPVEPGRSLVQRTLFAGPASWVSVDLYSKVNAGVARRRRNELRLDAGAIVHTNSYFGRFEASYWQRWTTATTVRVQVTVQGDAEGAVLVRASDIGSHERTVTVAHVEGGGTVTLDAPIDKFLDGGAMWLEFRAVDGTLTFTDVRWTVAEDDTDRPVTEHRPTAIAICTFNRADDCANTVASLAADPQVLEIIDAVYVTDQGTDAVETRELFTETAAKLGDKLHYLRQPNLGGAGGFSRGMFEVTGRESHANILLMDDDVRVEPETVLRLTALANHATSPILVGAQMLYLYNPDYLLVSAERCNIDTLHAGLPADEWCLQDESVIEEVQERRIDAQYNAWWSCLVPAEVVREIGLPMPYFFQWDDIEYGLRARERGFPTVTMPGAAVWHADFYWKDGDDFGHYFSIRNGLITSSLRSGFDIKALSGDLRRRVGHALVGMQYGFAYTTLEAIEAFLEGPDALADGGQAALARIRQERSRFPETVKHGVAEIPNGAPTRRAVGRLKPGKEDQVLAKRVVQQATGRIERGPVVVPYEDSFWWHVSLFDNAYVTDASQTGVRVRRRDPELAKELGKRAVRVFRRFHAEAPAVRDAFRAAQPQLTSRENWARLYGV
ncbi:glycosyltransferase [Speluncibacter jeojiensis]|uniref:Glycosyltransferase n=1 Tax=Speluncibacter jeojiensis TaxID=2710754 RepID=A0A9X4LXL9_9ACTN|nr:glycosyltransferase [Rhodococcus sp. D2-41]MDG3014169.1 glycosyltransferase [Corynebacteriales bacterium D3-21]